MSDEELVALLRVRIASVVAYRMSPEWGNNRSVVTSAPVRVSLRGTERVGRDNNELQLLLNRIVDTCYTVDGFVVVGAEPGDMGQGAILVTFADTR